MLIHTPRHRSGLSLVLLISLIILILAAAVYQIWIVQPFQLITPELQLELGQPLPDQPADYLVGNPNKLSDVSIDASAVQIDQLGRYNLSLQYKRRPPLIVEVVVVDTTPPIAQLTASEITVVLGQQILAADWVTGVRDYAPTELSWLPDTVTPSLDPVELGDLRQIIYVTDTSGNQTELAVSIHVIAAEPDPPQEVTAVLPGGDLLAAEAITWTGDSAVAPLQAVLDYLGDRAAQMGIVYRDIQSGEGFAINAEKQFRSASTAKVFVNMALYDAVAEGRFTLDQLIEYTDSDYEGGTGILQNMDLTKPYTLGVLADYAMLHSDNIAFNMIRRTVGRAASFDYYETVIGHPTNRSNTSMGAADGAALMLELAQSDSADLAHMVDMMKKTDFNTMLPRYLPEGSVAHKVGFYDTYYHDIGIIGDGSADYILSVFSNGLDNPQDVIAEVSRLVYVNR